MYTLTTQNQNYLLLGAVLVFRFSIEAFEKPTQNFKVIGSIVFEKTPITNS